MKLSFIEWPVFLCSVSVCLNFKTFGGKKELQKVFKKRQIKQTIALSAAVLIFEFLPLSVVQCISLVWRCVELQVGSKYYPVNCRGKNCVE